MSADNSVLEPYHFSADMKKTPDPFPELAAIVVKATGIDTGGAGYLGSTEELFSRALEIAALHGHATSHV
jgi:hypothetical protein